MKKKLLLGFFVSILSVSCSTRNQIQTTRNNSHTLKGTWQITSIDYDKNYKIKPFDEGIDINCFVGSLWKFVTNNNSGSYSITDSNCPSLTTQFKFNMTEDNKFSFKKIPNGIKEKSITAGYYLQMRKQTSDSFELVQTLRDGFSSFNVVYHFNKRY